MKKAKRKKPQAKISCPICYGTGKLYALKCRYCAGSGKVFKGL